ncbi:MAG: DUF3667 domain-containing protein [Pedobacter sp.]|nr:MAG: DUF3667 domain-containing protein [Pedobacter sp.]
MENNCTHCNQLITENFCSNCGQKKYKRIDRKYLWEELQYTIFHTNKGLLYSIKNIIKNPGKTARAFIDGDRVNHYKPILLVFLLSGISAFISYKIIGLNEMMGTFYDQEKLNSPFMNDYMSFISSYNSIFMLLLLPCFALMTKLAFRKWGQNYYEHVVMNAYILSFYTLVSIILVYPILYFYKNNPEQIIPIVSMSMLILPFVLIWFFKEFYADKPLKSIIIRSLFIILWALVFFFLLVIAMGIAGFVYGMIKGPEAMEYFLPQQKP